MIQALFDAAETVHKLKHRFAFLSLPDIFFADLDYNPNSSNAVRLLAHGGMSVFRHHHKAQSKLALFDLYQQQHCYLVNHDDGNDKYNGRPIRTILSIQLDAEFFGLRQFYRGWDSAFVSPPELTEFHFDRGTRTLANSSQTPEEYWEWMRSRITRWSIFYTRSIDLLLLHGTQVTRPELGLLLRDIFRENENLKEEEYLRDAEEHTFAAARAAARIARHYLPRSFPGCFSRSGYSITQRIIQALHLEPVVRWLRTFEHQDLGTWSPNLVVWHG